jgi:type IV pilus assembly protein PilO
MKKPSMTKMPAVPKFDIRALTEDFKSLDAKDIGTWPLLPRITVLLILFAGLLAGGWWLDWKSQIEDLEEMQRQEAKLKQEYLDKKKLAVNLEEHRRQLAEVDKSFGALLKQLPNKAEMESLLIDINQAGLGRGLQFELFKPGREAALEFYAELPITLKISGSYHDLGAFAADVAKLSRIVSLSNIAVAPDKGGQLKMDATAMTYRYLDEEELAAQRRAKAAQTQAKGAKK